MADDTTLISRAQNGDELAFTDLVRRYHPFVYAIVIGIMKDSDDAEEVVQDVFVNTYRGLPQLENASKFKGWLAEIARNCVRDRLRGQRVDTVSINEVSDDTLQAPGSLDAQLIRDEQRALILSAMESLSGKDKEIVKGYYLDGESYDELIRTHGLSYKAISVRLSRAKRKLAKRLRHLLTGVFVTPSMTIKQIGTGGLTIMKVGTVPKITAGVIAILGLGFIVTHHFILSKEYSSPTVEIIASSSAPRTDLTRKRVVTASQPANEPHISAKEMAQIENFFQQLGETNPQDLQKSKDTFLSEIDGEVALDTFETEADSKPQEDRFIGLTRPAIEAKTVELRNRIHQALEERLDLLDLVDEFAEFSREDKEIYLLRRQTFEETRELRKAIFTLCNLYIHYTQNDSQFQPGGDFYDLMVQNHIGVSIER